jgi:uncharacterized membrane protein YbhN (UPF0104 family)
MVGWTEWLNQIAWALIILAVAHLILRQGTQVAAMPSARELAARAWRALQGIIAHGSPALFAQLCILSLIAFALLEVAIYAVMMAFTTETVLLNIAPEELLLALVAGSLAARLIPLTPGGLGQFELGFAGGFFLLGGGPVEITLNFMVVALMANALRIVTGLVVMGVIGFFHGVPTDLRTVLTLFGLRRPQDRTAVLDNSSVPAE